MLLSAVMSWRQATRMLHATKQLRLSFHVAKHWQHRSYRCLYSRQLNGHLNPLLNLAWPTRALTSYHAPTRRERGPEARLPQVRAYSTDGDTPGAWFNVWVTWASLTRVALASSPADLCLQDSGTLSGPPSDNTPVRAEALDKLSGAELLQLSSVCLCPAILAYQYVTHLLSLLVFGRPRLWSRSS